MDVEAVGADEVEQVAGVDAGRLEELLAEGAAELVDVPVERPPGVLDDLAHERVAVGVQARAGHPQHHVAGADALRTEHRGILHDPGRGTGDVVLVRLEQARVLGGLATDEGDAGLLAGAGDAADDGGDALGHDLAGRDVVGHEERLGAAHDDVVDDHADEVEADGVVDVEGLGDGDLGADTVGRRREDGSVHAGDGAGVEHAREAAEPAEDLGTGRATDVGLHQLDGLVTGLDVDSGCGIGDLFACCVCHSRRPAY